MRIKEYKEQFNTLGKKRIEHLKKAYDLTETELHFLLRMSSRYKQDKKLLNKLLT